jgi:hypothetical protein
VIVAYRDDRQALALQLADLERENQELREEVARLQDAAKRQRDETQDEARRVAGQRGCVMCGGSLLPVALYAARDIRSPMPLSISTLRFGDSEGGFTRSAPIMAKVCATCGFIHTWIDIEGSVAIVPEVEEGFEPPDEPEPEPEQR